MVMDLPDGQTPRERVTVEGGVAKTGMVTIWKMDGQSLYLLRIDERV